MRSPLLSMRASKEICRDERHRDSMLSEAASTESKRRMLTFESFDPAFVAELRHAYKSFEKSERRRRLASQGIENAIEGQFYLN